MSSVLAEYIESAIEKRVPTGSEIAELLRSSARHIPYICRYLVHDDARVRFVAADALFRISRSNRSAITKYLDAILRGLKFQDVKTRIKLLRTISPVVFEYPTRVERYLATISWCLYNPEHGRLRSAAARCIGNLAAIDERRASLYIPMLLQTINKHRYNPETWNSIHALAFPLRNGNAKRFRKRIREVIIPFRRRGEESKKRIVRRILKLSTTR